MTPLSTELVQYIREALDRHPEADHIEVQGHTDDTGVDNINNDVSLKRAQTVRDFLVAHGIEGDKLVARGYSWSRPVADNRHFAGRQQNRRVEFVLVPRRAP